MNLKIEITSKEEALEAITLLQAYTGSTVVVKSDEKKSTKPAATKSKTTTKKVEEADKTSDEVEASDIDLKALTQIAKEAVERSDRAAAKKVISKYGSKLSEVEESDYSALAKELEELGA